MPSPTRSSEQFAIDFWARVDRGGGPESCWPWTGSRGRYGHGNVWRNGRNEKSHRVAFELTYGRQPEGLGRHTCDNPPCCNPTHVVDGTHADNMADMASRGRASRHGGSARGDRNGARLHPERVPRGQRQGGAKLTDEAVREIRRLHAAGLGTTYTLASGYGVSQSTVAQIVRGVKWKHVERSSGELVRQGMAQLLARLPADVEVLP